MPALTREELQELTDHAEAQARGLYIASSAFHRELGAEWYDEAASVASMIARTSPKHLTRLQAAAIVAVLSPRMPWADNVIDAKALAAEEYLAHGFRALGTNLAKAFRIIEGEDIDTVLGGRKVRSFYRNIAHPQTSHDVTIDGWMLRALVHADNLAPYTSAANFLARKGVYDAVSQGVRNFADTQGLRAHVVQATVWIHLRGTHE